MNDQQKSEQHSEVQDQEIRAALDQHWAASDADDFETEHRIYPAADLLDDAAVLVSHRRGLVHRAYAAIAPQVRSPDTCRREPYVGIRLLGYVWVGGAL